MPFHRLIGHFFLVMNNIPSRKYVWFYEKLHILLQGSFISLHFQHELLLFHVTIRSAFGVGILDLGHFNKVQQYLTVVMICIS